MTTVETPLDTGTGYGRPPGTHNARLTEVGPGTPMGEALRRYWQPIASSEALTSDVPHRTKLLGEALIVFRDGNGNPGVVAERCAHRGSSLFYGRVEEDGIRCCYHGWKFDVQGRCLEQACEPALGRRREAARQPWYPVEERYGLVYVYMGPPDRKPPLPTFEFMELGPGESYFSSLPAPGAEVVGMVTPCNWLQVFENAVDQTHATWLHHAHSGTQFEGVGGPTGYPVDAFDPNKIAERISFDRTDDGVSYDHRFERELPDGTVQKMVATAECQLPNIIMLPDFVQLPVGTPLDTLIYIVPADDTSHRAFVATRGTGLDRMLRLILGIKQNGKFPFEMSEEELQRFPGDAEAQISQGPITLHSEETLATSDKGVVFLRRMLTKMVDDAEAGNDPLNTGPAAEKPRTTVAGMRVKS